MLSTIAPVFVSKKVVPLPPLISTKLSVFVFVSTLLLTVVSTVGVVLKLVNVVKSVGLTAPVTLVVSIPVLNPPVVSPPPLYEKSKPPSSPSGLG